MKFPVYNILRINNSNHLIINKKFSNNWTYQYWKNNDYQFSKTSWKSKLFSKIKMFFSSIKSNKNFKHIGLLLIYHH